MSGFKRKVKPLIILDEVPSELKQLARLVVRGFFTAEDILIIDMLVRNPCMKEDDIAELLRFEKKQLRARMGILKNAKFVQERQKLESNSDGKTQKVYYYFIQYKRFVNAVKYRLDQVHKRLEAAERLVTSRASFRCLYCQKTFTDLEADQLFDFVTEEFKCTICSRVVEEDTALPAQDCRLKLGRFNEQMQVLYELLSSADGIQLSRKVLEPEPVDIDFIRGIPKPYNGPRESLWSGEATRVQGTPKDAHVDFLKANEKLVVKGKQVKERPVWMRKSTVDQIRSPETSSSDDSSDSSSADEEDDDEEEEEEEEETNKRNVVNTQSLNNYTNTSSKDDCDEIMALLWQYEARLKPPEFDEQSETYNYKQENEDEIVPIVLVAGRPYPVDEVTEANVANMTAQEKIDYIHVYQSYYSEFCDEFTCLNYKK